MPKIKADVIIDEMVAKYPALGKTSPALLTFCEKMITLFKRGGRLFIAGNGGSAADAQHIVAELMKSFERKRPLSDKEKALFNGLPDGNKLACHLENGFPAIALGLNHSLTSAIWNDFRESHLEFAQELWVLAKKGDALLGISTSGTAKNVFYAMLTARAKGLYAVSFTGNKPNRLKEIADLALLVPSNWTAEVQQMQAIVYHTFCRILEKHFFT